MDLLWLACEVVEVVSDDWPGSVRVRFVDANGRPRELVDKAPIFDVEIDDDVVLPVPAAVRCTLIDTSADGRRLIVSTAVDGVATEDGTDVFVVTADQVARFGEQPSSRRP